MDFSFDIRGNLQPPEIIDLSFEDLEQIFVLTFEETSTRHQIFANYQQFLTDIQEIIPSTFVQWIDGSFVSNRTNPNDIDLITIVNFEIYELNKRIFEDQFASANVRAKYPGVDAYVVADYPPGHPKHFFTVSDLAYWRNLFGQTRVLRTKKQLPKGFIKIEYGRASSI